MRCLSSARFNMRADVLRQGTSPDPTVDPNEGTWEYQQDPLTHEIVRVWVPAVIIPDDATTPDVDETTFLHIPCMARGVIEGGIRVAGTIERWGEEYVNEDYVRLWFPARYVLTQRDKVTNIKNRRGQVIWRDEEVGTGLNGFRSTVFDVEGVTPVLDPFGNHIENYAMLKKSEVNVDAQ